MTDDKLDSEAMKAIGDAALVIRDRRVLLDSDLATLYGVTTKAFNQAIKRNADRFPADFMFRLNIRELRDNRSQFVTGSKRHRDLQYAPFVFTEHGAIMAAMLLNSSRAIEMSVYVVRAFVQMREMLLDDRVFAGRLAVLERSLVSLDADTRRQFEEVFDAIRALQISPAKSRPIGFTADIESEDSSTTE